MHHQDSFRLRRMGTRSCQHKQQQADPNDGRCGTRELFHSERFGRPTIGGSATSASISRRWTKPATNAPTIGASQNSHSCDSAQPPTNSAGPVLRAGLTEVLVTGMLTRWIITSARPMASGAKPAGALPWVAPMMTNRNIAVIVTSMRKHATRLYLP